MGKLQLYVLFTWLFVFHVEVSYCLPFFFGIFTFIISSFFFKLSGISFILSVPVSVLFYFVFPYRLQFLNFPSDFYSNFFFLDLLQSLSAYLLKIENSKLITISVFQNFINIYIKTGSLIDILLGFSN